MKISHATVSPFSSRECRPAYSFFPSLSIYACVSRLLYTSQAHTQRNTKKAERRFGLEKKREKKMKRVVIRSAGRSKGKGGSVDDGAVFFYFLPSRLIFLAGVGLSPSSISSLTSSLRRRPPCSQASGVYHVLSCTQRTEVMNTVELGSFRPLDSVLNWVQRTRFEIRLRQTVPQ
jgi:hypothetical protein